MFHVKHRGFYTDKGFHVKHFSENSPKNHCFLLCAPDFGMKKEAFQPLFFFNQNIVVSSQFPIQLCSTRNFVIVDASICWYIADINPSDGR